MAIPPAYTAQAVLLLDPQPTRLATTGVSPEATPLDSGVVDSQAQILASRSLAQQAIDKLGLVSDPELTGQPAGLARAVDRLAADRDGAGLAAAGTDPVARFLERLDLRREGKSYVITLAYRSTDAAKAAQVANTVAQLYLAGQLERKTAATRAARELLTVQTQGARAQLDEAQQRLQAFRTGAEPVALARPAGSDDEVAEMNRQLVLASADRIAAETRVNQLRTSLTDGHPGALDSGSVLLQNLSALKADVLRREAELSGQFGARHPRVQDLHNEEATLDERIGEAQRAEMRNREGEVEAARAKERTLASSLEALKGRAKRQDESAHRAELLESEVELRRRSYEGLVERANSLAELDGMHEPDARVISEAVPPTTPTFPRPKLLVSLGGVVGLALGLALLVLLESRDGGFRGRAEVQASLGLPTLALVPELPAGRNATAPQDYVLEKPRSRYAEALREILAAVMLEPCQGQKGRVVLLTSVLREEGKSTLTLSLGRLAAAEGMRVLALDVDLRHPSLHRLAGPPPGPGVIELLRGDTPPEDAIRTDPRTDLRILASSGRLSQPTRLLTADRLGCVLDLARERFDLVLVDAAPLAAVADARLLAPLADGTVLVVRWAHTRREACVYAIAELGTTGATVLGAVLSRVDPKKQRESRAAEAGVPHARLARYYAD